MNNDKRKVEVNIMGKLYSVACPQQQEEKLTEAVSFLNNTVEDLKRRMNGVKSIDTVSSRDSLLAIAALNISYELLKMNTTISSRALEAEKLIEQIKSSFEQLNVDGATQKISEMSL